MRHLFENIALWFERWILESSKFEFAVVTIACMFAGFTLIAFSLYSLVRF